MKPKVMIVSGASRTTTETYRCWHAKEALERAGIFCSVFSDMHPRLQSLADLHDIIILQRVAHDGVIDRLFELDKTFIFDVDDLVFETDVAQWVAGLALLPKEEVALYHDGLRRYQRTLKRSDYVMCSTVFLGQRAEALGTPAIILRNAVSQSMLAAAKRVRVTKDPSRFVIGYVSGTRTHDRDFLVAADAILAFLEERLNAEFWVQGELGLDARFSRFGERVRRLPLVPLNRIFEAVGHFDLSIAPLERDNPFCRGKSEIKYFESALMKVPTVASPTDAYELAITSGRNGFLSNGPEEWLAAFRELADNPPLWRTMGQLAHDDVLQHHTTAARSQELAEDLMLVWREKKARPRPPRIEPQVSNAKLKVGCYVSEPEEGSGGHMTIFRNLRYMEQFGHEVTVYVRAPRKGLPTGKELRAFIRRHFVPLEAEVVVGWDAPRDCDALIATFHTSVQYVAAAKNARHKFYLVQDFEPWFYPMGNDYLMAEGTYRAGLSCLCIGRWLPKKLSTEYGADANFFDFAVDRDIYFPRGAKGAIPRVIFYAQPEKPRRAFELGVAALQNVYQALEGRVEIVLFGGRNVASHYVPFPYRDLGILSSDELAQLYSSSHVALVISSSNPSLVPFDMMACGCAVVDLDRENNHEDYVNGEDILLAQPSAEALAQAVCQLVTDGALRERLVRNGLRLVGSRTYEQSARRFEALLLQGLTTGSVSERPDLVADGLAREAAEARAPGERRENQPVVTNQSGPTGASDYRDLLDQVERLRTTAAAEIARRDDEIARLRSIVAARSDKEAGGAVVSASSSRPAAHAL